MYVLSSSATIAQGAVVDATIASGASTSTTRSHAIPIQLSRAAELSYLSSSVPIGSAATGDSRDSASRDAAAITMTHEAAASSRTSVVDAVRRRATSMAIERASPHDDIAGRSVITRSTSRLLPLDNNIEPTNGHLNESPPTGVALVYHIETLVALEEIEGVTLGVNSQSVTIETRHHRTFRRAAATNALATATGGDSTATSGEEVAQREFAVETASSELGVCVAAAIQRAIRRHTSQHRYIAIGSGASMYSIILHNWLANTLNMPRTSQKVSLHFNDNNNQRY